MRFAVAPDSVLRQSVFFPQCSPAAAVVALGDAQQIIDPTPLGVLTHSAASRPSSHLNLIMRDGGSLSTSSQRSGAVIRLSLAFRRFLARSVVLFVLQNGKLTPLALSTAKPVKRSSRNSGAAIAD